MNKRAVNDAVVAYRKVMLIEFDLEQLRARLNAAVRKFDKEGMDEYLRLTMLIDDADDFARATIDDMKWSPSTARQEYRRHVGAAGRDTSTSS